MPRLRFAVEQWLKGTGPNVVYVHGPFYTPPPTGPVHSCMHQLPVNVRIVMPFKAIGNTGTADGLHEYDYLKDTNLFVRPYWSPKQFGLEGSGQ